MNSMRRLAEAKMAALQGRRPIPERAPNVAELDEAAQRRLAARVAKKAEEEAARANRERTAGSWRPAVPRRNAQQPGQKV